ncbi:hypothetical protein V496_01723 [Pseudogymnoascus sp. VKM F-4515 (FW-2607)]|nr:hypothetical protein V496_01723 [Pseudogymnoascus sp. VKM F-4515 (FW-2607)]KFY92837.1 hypothetical protein V498_04714 [Pseudogymnoascus sp. VKM F-4517 (FW-2822)]
MPLLPRAVKVADLPGSLSFSGQAILITARGIDSDYHNSKRCLGGAAARETIESVTGKKGIVRVRILDMNTFASVKDFVDGLQKDVKRVAIVLLSAGCVEFTYTKSPDGWETDLQINTAITAAATVDAKYTVWSAAFDNRSISRTVHRASPIINTVRPGPVKTNLSRHFASRSIFHQALVALITVRSLSPEEGARALVLATTTTPAENGK